jgi:hypothetical protein
MAINIPRGKSDPLLDTIIAELENYQKNHGDAEIDIYRQNSVSVRVRIVDPDFANMNKPERNNEVWKYLEQLPDDVQSDISTLLLLTPDEKKESFANFEFDDPVPSEL